MKPLRRPYSDITNIILAYSIIVWLCVVSRIEAQNGHISLDKYSNGISIKNYQTGPLSSAQSTLFEITENQQNDDQQKVTRRPTNVLTGTIMITENPPKSTKPNNNNQEKALTHKKENNYKKHEEVLSIDCVSKRNEILHKLDTSTNKLQNVFNVTRITPTSNLQRLKPRKEFNNNVNHNNNSSDTIQHKITTARTLGNDLDGEHVPQCNQDGGYEPVQCHKIGYCWCVNKYGQAIKNSATLAGQTPYCNPELYDDESKGSLVVTGTTERRIKSILKSPSSSGSASNGGSSATNSDSSSNQDSDYDVNQEGKLQQVGTNENDFERRVSATKQPSLALLPNECALSNSKAKERASSFTDNIWIPSCDVDNSKLYAERQCHYIKAQTMVCWCVDQNTGLPLKTSEQIGKQQTSINCTEIKRLNGIIDNVLKNHQSHNGNSHGNEDETSSSSSSSLAYTGFSELCDTQKRTELVNSLIKQFKQQIHDYMIINSETSRPITLPSTMSSDNVNETEIAELKFATLDTDNDGKLDIGEWFKFKNNFKLVDRIEDLQTRSQKGRHSITPLSISRSQRRCWRDFILYCGNGNLSNDDEPISLSNWLNCTQLPVKTNTSPVNHHNNNRQMFHQSSDPEDIPEDIYESLKALVRSNNKNPFVGILKP